MWPQCQASANIFPGPDQPSWYCRASLQKARSQLLDGLLAHPDAVHLAWNVELSALLLFHTQNNQAAIGVCIA